MAALPESAADVTVAHQIALIRYANGAVQRLIAILNRAEPQLLAKLSAALDAAPDSASATYLASILKSVRTLNSQAYEQLQVGLQDEMKTVSGNEANWTHKLYVSAVDDSASLVRLSAEQAYAAAYSRPFQGRLLKEWASGLDAKRMERIRDTVRMGYLEGETTGQIVSKLRGTRAAGYADGLLEIDRQHAETVIRTALSHTANMARTQFFDANEEILGSIMWVATLDGRTSAPCRLRDHKRYTVTTHKPIDHSYPWSGGPGRLHFGCRSAQIALLKGQTKLYGTRASKDGQVDANLTYNDWLKKQPAHVQDEVLGPDRAALFRSGGLDVQDFANNKGKAYKLAELQTKDAEAFSRAGLSREFQQPAPSGRFADQFESVKADTATPARAAMVKFEEAVRGGDKEIAAFFDDQGAILARRTGLPDRVSFPVSITDQMAGMSFSHSHPGDTSFSLSDVVNAADIKLAELRAVGPEMRYIMQPGAGGWPKELALRGAYDESYKAAVQSVMSMIRANEISSRDADGHVPHLVWIAVARSLGLSYFAERS